MEDVTNDSHMELGPLGQMGTIKAAPLNLSLDSQQASLGAAGKLHLRV